ncbi:hypothetical protein LOK49_Contig8G00010 [Camellia lanceoleosa]|nr:hypothetical protein LOK49_Contig8G00010 [Camellia lanceoleosa]
MVLLASSLSFMVKVWANYHWPIGPLLQICPLSMEQPWVSSL